MAKNEKVVMLCENQKVPVKVIDEENFVLEGIAAFFGRENENHRIYEEEEYLPHLKYLQEKIKRRKLVGELDHPDKFYTSLQKVSHIIEKLWYDKEDRSLKCRIRVLDTDPHGLNARKLVKAGYPISLSSRAAGVVQENKRVKIKRIFAYDFVADGGFGDEAELERVNESLGFDVKELNKTELPLLNESLGFDTENVKIYDVTDKYPEYLSEDADFSNLDIFEDEKDTKKSDTENIYNKNNNNFMGNPVTIEEMYKYSLIIKEKIELFEKEMANIKDSLKNINESDENKDSELYKSLTEKIEKLELENKKLNEKIEKSIKYSEKIAEQSNNTLGYAERLGNEIQLNRDYSEKLSENINLNRDYSEKVGEILNQNINYTEKITEGLNNQHEYVTEIIREQLNNSINYSERISENLNNLAEYAEKIGKTTNSVIKYTTYIAKNSVVKEDFQNLINYTEEMFESNNINKNNTKVNENIDNENIDNDLFEGDNMLNHYKNINEKFNQVLEKIKTKKVEEKVDEKYPFLKNLNESQVEKFNSLSEAQKTKANSLISKEESLNEEKFNSIIKKSFDLTDRWLVEIPEDIKPIWEKLDEGTKDVIRRRAQWYNLESDYQIRNFWANQKLIEVEETINDNNKINENKKEESKNKLGYDSSYVSKIGNALDRF